MGGIRDFLSSIRCPYCGSDHFEHVYRRDTNARCRNELCRKFFVFYRDENGNSKTSTSHQPIEDEKKG